MYFNIHKYEINGLTYLVRHHVLNATSQIVSQAAIGANSYCSVCLFFNFWKGTGAFSIGEMIRNDLTWDVLTNL